eukprot:1339815-Amorphochlora_amoeboformis.AAC.3
MSRLSAREVAAVFLIRYHVAKSFASKLVRPVEAFFDSIKIFLFYNFAKNPHIYKALGVGPDSQPLVLGLEAFLTAHSIVFYVESLIKSALNRLAFSQLTISWFDDLVHGETLKHLEHWQGTIRASEDVDMGALSTANHKMHVQLRSGIDITESDPPDCN